MGRVEGGLFLHSQSSNDYQVMLNLETIIGIAGAFGGLEALKWLANLRSTRRKADGEAAESVENVVAKRVKTYEDSILFLQNQLQEKEKQFAELSAKYQESMQRELKLTQALGDMKLKYRSSRCDRKECENRKPPFAWLRKAAAKAVPGLTLVLLFAASASCTRKVYIPVEKEITVRDSVERRVNFRDSVVRLDSILMYVKGDTVVKECWRVRDRVALRHDTLRIVHRDTVVTPRIVEVGRKEESGRSWKWMMAASIAVLATGYMLGRKYGR